MNAKHTPAPWVGHFRESHWSVWGDGRLIGTVATDDDVHLVLAAPQMLEALEQAATLIYQYHNIGALLGSDHGLCPEYEDCKLCTTVRSLRSVLRAARGQEAS